MAKPCRRRPPHGDGATYDIDEIDAGSSPAAYRTKTSKHRDECAEMTSFERPEVLEGRVAFFRSVRATAIRMSARLRCKRPHVRSNASFPAWPLDLPRSPGL